MASRAPVLRLFVALYPPADLVEEMLTPVRSIDLPPHRTTDAHQLHMTLQFIGDRHERELDDVIESVERSAAGLRAFELAPMRMVTLPERGKARLVALETTGPAPLMEMQRRLAHRLADPKRRSRGKFLPHLTLCRFAGEVTMERLEQAVSLRSFWVTEIKLMSSVLRPSGAEHGTVHAVALEETPRS